jgi:16S rRNA (adenine1518-N6/adenine1519-N6)-dimethyltransferase
LAKSRRPKLGQHFLISDTYRRRVADALPVHSDDVLLEIGPGHGAMTGLLVQLARKVLAVEIDAQLVDHLRTQFAGDNRVEVLRADILRVDLAATCRHLNVDSLFVFGNLPYYITSPILHHLLDSASRLRGMAFVVQREVAERISAKPGSRAYGYLSVLAQAYTEPGVALSIPPGAFSPPPAVHSALVTFDMTGALAGWDRGQVLEFLDFVKLGFSQKRKKLANNLASAYPLGTARDALRACGFSENVRAEELAVLDFVRLFDHLKPQLFPDPGRKQPAVLPSE